MVRERDKLLGVPRDEANRASVWPKFLGAILVAGAVGAAFVIGRASTDAEPPQRNTANNPRDAVPVRQGAAEESNVPPPSSPVERTVDISAPVTVSGGGCSFGPVLDRALRNMVVISNDTRLVRPGRVDVAEQRLVPQLTTEGYDSADETERAYTATARLHRPANWNGLHLSGLRVSAAYESYSMSLEFAESPDRLQAVLRNMRLSVPLPPGQRGISGPACFSAIAIDARSGGSALSCGGGC
jgi:hypothetical protein